MTHNSSVWIGNPCQIFWYPNTWNEYRLHHIMQAYRRLRHLKTADKEWGEHLIPTIWQESEYSGRDEWYLIDARMALHRAGLAGMIPSLDIDESYV